MERFFKRFGLAAAGVVAAASLGGCNAGAWEAIGNRLLDGVSLQVGMDQDGEMTAGVGFSTELAASRSRERANASWRTRMIEMAMSEPGAARSQAGPEVGLSDREREEVRAMMMEELFQSGWTRASRD